METLKGIAFIALVIAGLIFGWVTYGYFVNSISDEIYMSAFERFMKRVFFAIGGAFFGVIIGVILFHEPSKDSAASDTVSNEAPAEAVAHVPEAVAPAEAVAHVPEVVTPAEAVAPAPEVVTPAEIEYPVPAGVGKSSY